MAGGGVRITLESGPQRGNSGVTYKKTAFSESKSSPITGLNRPECSRRLRLPDIKTFGT